MTQKTSEQILTAAAAILAKEGASAITLRRVAKAAKITPMAIYHHYDGLDDLLRALVDREIQHFIEFIQAAPLRKTHEAALIHTPDAYLEFALQFPKTFMFLFGEPRAGARKFPEDFRAGRSPSLNLLADVVRAAMADGYLRKADVWDVTFQLWAHNHGYATLYLAGRIGLSKTDFFDLVHQSLKRFLYGLKT
jgi:AcrR family transcriptional regulator